MNIERLKGVLSIPTVSGREELIREYLVNYAKNNNINYEEDFKGNIYFTKGELSEGEYYPCVVSHTDTVHRNQLDLVNSNGRLDLEVNDGVITAYHPLNGMRTGTGGDDKCGVAICLDIFESVDVIKAVFFVEEEIGMRGSMVVDFEWTKDCAYFIQFDAPTANWVSLECMGVKLASDSFIDKLQPVFDKFGQTNLSSDPFTDVLALREITGFNCINYFAGYDKMHSSLEFVVIEHVEKAVEIGKATIELLGNIREDV